MIANSHRTNIMNDVARQFEDPEADEIESPAASYYYDDATNYEVYREDDDEIDDGSQPIQTERPARTS